MSRGGSQVSVQGLSPPQRASWVTAGAFPGALVPGPAGWIPGSRRRPTNSQCRRSAARSRDGQPLGESWVWAASQAH
jgi:hypothetical protein